MRQLCNVSFIAQTEWLDKKEHNEFLHSLDAPFAQSAHSPDQGRRSALMSIMSTLGKQG